MNWSFCGRLQLRYSYCMHNLYIITHMYVHVHIQLNCICNYVRSQLAIAICDLASCISNVGILFVHVITNNCKSQSDCSYNIIIFCIQTQCVIKVNRTAGMNIKHQDISNHSPGGQKARECLPIGALVYLLSQITLYLTSYICY